MPIGQAILIVTLCSAILVWPVRRVRVLNAVSALGVPFVVAYCAYWVPVWLRPPDLNNINDLHNLDMYNAWAAGEIGMLFVPALLVSLTIVAVAVRRRAKRKRLGPAA